jgi:hypothetical protein
VIATGAISLALPFPTWRQTSAAWFLALRALANKGVQSADDPLAPAGVRKSSLGVKHPTAAQPLRSVCFSNDGEAAQPVDLRSLLRIPALTTAAIAIALGSFTPAPVLAWGDEGHEIVGLVAQAFLDPDVHSKVTGPLATDTDSLTAHDIASEAT